MDQATGYHLRPPGVPKPSMDPYVIRGEVSALVDGKKAQWLEEEKRKFLQEQEAERKRQDNLLQRYGERRNGVPSNTYDELNPRAEARAEAEKRFQHMEAERGRQREQKEQRDQQEELLQRYATTSGRHHVRNYDELSPRAASRAEAEKRFQQAESGRAQQHEREQGRGLALDQSRKK